MELEVDKPTMTLELLKDRQLFSLTLTMLKEMYRTLQRHFLRLE